MISLLRKARPRRSPNRVRLVELDGTPVVQPTADFALSWGGWTDNHYWEATDRVVGVDSMGADVHESDCPEPDDDGRRDGAALWAEMMIEASLPPVRIPGIDPETETDAEFLARVASEEDLERARVLATYQPTLEDLREFEAWSAGLDSDALPASMADHFTLGEHSAEAYDAVRRGQVSETELAMMAAHGCI
jgi:hypothetical protein